MWGEFYKTDGEWIEELHIWEKSLRNAKSTLKKLWFVTIKAKGNPPITHYNIDEDLLIKFLTKTEESIDETDSLKDEIDIAQRAELKTTKGRNRKRPKGKSLITETTTETTTESISKDIEQSSEEKNQKKKSSIIPKTENWEHQESEKVPAEKIEYGDKEINAMYEFLKKVIGVDEFTESHKWQRIYAKHFLNWGIKNGKEELTMRLNWVLSDPFKQKKSNSLIFLYNEVKAFIHTPVVEPEKKNSNVTFW